MFNSNLLNKSKKKRVLTHTLALFMIAIFVTSFLPAIQIVEAQCASVRYYAEDTITGGDWFFNPIGSPIGVYGSYAHILPNAPQNRLEVPVGEFSTPIGGLGDLGKAPYSWTSSQINGLQFYKADPPYWDEYESMVPPVTYHVNGTRIYSSPPDPRALQNIESGTTYTRAACWFAGSGSSPSKITLELDLTAGSYLLSLYILDYDSTIRRGDIKVSLSSDSLVTDTKSVGVDFSSGFYENFFVYIDENTADTVIVEITKTAGANAVVSGVFLSSTSSMPTISGQDEIRWESEDTTTQGNWIGTYGDIGYIKCAWNVPLTKAAYWSWVGGYDHASLPSGASYIVSTSQYAWTPEGTLIDYIQYPVFEWAWFGWHSSQTEHREVYYKTTIPGIGGPGWRLATWDDGGERCQPIHGFMNFTLTFHGEGTYLLSLYAYDYEITSRASQEYRIFDASGTTLLASKQISGAAFDNGVYEIFEVVVPPGGCTIIVQVYNDAGHPTPTLNLVLSGIFIDKIETEEWCGKTIGFWKANIGKQMTPKKIKGKGIQVPIDDISTALNSIQVKYSGLGLPSDIEGAWYLLDYRYSNGKKAAKDPAIKAKAQTLALLLTTEIFGGTYDPELIEIGNYGSDNVSGWMEQILEEFNKGSNADYKFIYNIADFLNNLGCD